MQRKKVKVMLVERSGNLRSVLKEYFKTLDFTVIDYENGESAIRNYRHGCCDICLINTQLPRKDGYDVLWELRMVSPRLPVIFVTSQDHKDERIKGFEAGCDDYVTKPFCIHELVPRIEAVLECCKKERKETAFSLEINKLTFTEKESKILGLLYRNKNRLVPRNILIKEIWGKSKSASGRSLDVYISRLRTYLQEVNVEILNVHGMGYLLKEKCNS